MTSPETEKDGRREKSDLEAIDTKDDKQKKKKVMTNASGSSENKKKAREGA